MKLRNLFLAVSLFYSACLCSQVQRTNTAVKKTTASGAVTTEQPVKTTSTQTAVKNTGVATIHPESLVYLNSHNKGNAALLRQKINPALNNVIAKAFEYSKDISYSDGTKIHLRLKKNPAIETETVKATAKQTGQDQGDGYNCITSNVSLSASSTDFIINDYSQQAAHIYPGAIYTYEHLYDGSFREETANRNPIVIGCDNPNMTSPTYEQVIAPNQSNIDNALAKLFGRFHGAAGNESLAYQVFESSNNADLNIKVGAGGSGYGFSFSNTFNTQESEKHVYMTIDARKSLFTMSAALPDSGYFTTPVNSTSPLVILGSVSYGVRILANMEFTFLSKSDADNFKAAYSGFGVSANANLDVLANTTATSTQVNAYVIGGPSSGTNVSFDKKDLQQKIQSILSGATYQNARPISYEMYDMNGIVIGEQSATDQFTVRNCVPADVPTNLSDPQVSIRSGDDGKDKDTHYTLELFNSSGQEAAIYVNNSNSDEYAKNESNPVQMTAGTPTGEIKYSGSLPLPVMRAPLLADFSNGGKLHIKITPNGHDTWNIQTLTITLSFQNKKPQTITWSNKTLSQDTREKDFIFDGGFKAVE